MKQITVNLYKFDELEGKAKEKALSNLYDLNVDHDWWGSTYDDANQVGLEITGFDTGRGNSISYNAIVSEEVSKEKVIANHMQCETYGTANTKFESEEEYFRALAEDYLAMLRNEYEYLMSEEAVVKTIRANEYYFRVNGDLWGE